MDLRRHQRLREDFLVTLWELHAGNYGGDQSTREVCKRIGVDYDTEGSIIGQFLGKQELVKWSSFEWISLTSDGIREAERIVEERLVAKEFRVLEMIYDLTGTDHSGAVTIDVLVQETALPRDEIDSILNGLDQRSLIRHLSGDMVRITGPGIRAVESHFNKKVRGDSDSETTRV